MKAPRESIKRVNSGKPGFPSPSGGDEEYRKTAEDFLVSLRGYMDFDLGLVFLENPKDSRLGVIASWSKRFLSGKEEKLLSRWKISHEDLYRFNDEGLQHVPTIKRFLDDLDIRYCSYQIANVGGTRSVLVLLGDRRTDRRAERLRSDFTSFCQQMAENLGLCLYRRREERRKKHIKALMEVSRIVAETYELPLLMERTLSTINEHFRTKLSYVLLYDEKDRESISTISMEMGGSLLHLDPEMRNRLLQLARRKGMQPLADNLDATARGATGVGELPLLEVPIQVDGSTVGVIKCSMQEYMSVDELDLEFLGALANQLAAGIKNSLNYRRLQEKTSLLANLNAIARRLNGSLDLADMVPYLEEEMRKITGASDCAFVYTGMVSSTRVDMGGIPHETGCGKNTQLPSFHWMETEEEEGAPAGVGHLLVPVSDGDSVIGWFFLSFEENNPVDMDRIQQTVPPLMETVCSAVKRVAFFAEAVRERGKLQAVFDAMRDAVLVLDEGKRIIAANREAERIFGLERKGRMGKPVRGSLGIDVLEEFAEGDVAGGELEEMEALVPVEPPMPVRACRSRVVLPGGRTYGTVLVLRDVTHETQLDNLKDSFLACISHEINTPLAIVIGYTDILNTAWDILEEDAKKQYVESIRRSSERLHRVITDILVASRISRGRLELDRHPCLLEEMARDMVDQYRMIDKSHDYRLVCRHEGCMCDVDETKMRRVVWNLIDNARKFSPPGTSIQVTVGRRREGLFLAVRDEGIGISPWHIPSIFGKFTQVDPSDSRRASGLGMGLYLAKEIVNMHGGRIEVYSEPERGSTFTVILPSGDFCMAAGKEEVVA